MISKNSSHSTTLTLKDVVSKVADDLSKSLNYSIKKYFRREILLLGEIIIVIILLALCGMIQDTKRMKKERGDD